MHDIGAALAHFGELAFGVVGGVLLATIALDSTTGSVRRWCKKRGLLP